MAQISNNTNHPGENVSPESPAILLVDDNEINLKVLYQTLDGHGYKLLVARSGEDALRIARKAKPDLILLDIMMSSILDGVAVSQALESNPEWRKIPLIMVSSIASTEYAETFPTGEHLHVDRWLSKPTSPEELLKAISRFVS